jgi:hypothetical protein
VRGADILIFCAPHQFIRSICKQLIGKIKPDAFAISLIKVRTRLAAVHQVCNTDQEQATCLDISNWRLKENTASRASPMSASLKSASVNCNAWLQHFSLAQAAADLSSLLLQALISLQSTASAYSLCPSNDD